MSYYKKIKETIKKLKYFLIINIFVISFIVSVFFISEIIKNKLSLSFNEKINYFSNLKAVDNEDIKNSLKNIKLDLLFIIIGSITISTIIFYLIFLLENYFKKNKN